MADTTDDTFGKHNWQSGTDPGISAERLNNIDEGVLEALFRKPLDLTLTYDASDRLSKAEWKDSGGAVVRTVDLTYDSDGNLSSTTDTGAGLQVDKTLTYDADGLLTSVSVTRSTV